MIIFVGRNKIALHFSGDDEVSSGVLKPSSGTARRGRNALIYPDLLAGDVGSLLLDNKQVCLVHVVAASIPSKDD